MNTQTIDTTMLDETIVRLEAILQHRRTHPKEKSDEIYQEWLVNATRSIRYAKEEGKSLVASTVLIPSEILYAMDIVPMNVEFIAGIICQMTGTYEETFSAAKAYGFVPEICSMHRVVNGQVILGNLPRPDAVIWSNQVCDNTAKGGDPFVEIYGCPGFFLDRPYRYTDANVKYLTGELEDMVGFLEDVTHRKMDWDQLKEVVKRSQQGIDLYREIYELRKAVPSPIKSKRFNQFNIIEQLFPGAPTTLNWLRQVRDEVRENVAQGRGYVAEERYRLIHLFVPPFNMWRLFDWMEKEHGAVSVMEPYCSTWGQGDLDPEKPLESLATKCFFKPIARQMHGPVEEGVLRDTIENAIEYKAEGAIFWAHIGCREACACIKMLKDELRDQAGIPTLVLDNDLNDPTYVTEEQIKDKLEGFFELLDDRK